MNLRLLALAAVSVPVVAPAAPAAVGDPVMKLFSSDLAPYDDFGRSVAVDGDLMVVGAVGDDDQGTVSGSAYVFDVTTGQELLKLLPTDGAQVDNFGISVDIDGSRCIVGAYADDDLGNDSGSAYVFDVTTGQQLHKLLPSDGAAGDHFGFAVAMSGTTAIVGAFRHDHGGVKDTGAAYVFDVTTGQQVHKVVPGGVGVDEQFGRSVALDGATAVVGAYYRNGVGLGSGGAYVVDVVGGTSLGLLVPSDVAAADFHGWSVAISGDRALVSSPRDDVLGSSSGSVYLYDLTTGAVLQKFTASDGAASDQFGWAVAMDGALGVVGASWAQPNGAQSGAAYAFDLEAGLEIDRLAPPDGGPEERFGYAVAVRGDTIVCTAHHDDDLGKFSGSAYVYDPCPSALTFDATPPIAYVGDPLHFRTSGGAPGQPYGLYLSHLNGLPVWLQLYVGSFDVECRDVFSVPAAPAGLVGLTLDFHAYGFTATGPQLSNVDSILFQ